MNPEKSEMDEIQLSQSRNINETLIRLQNIFFASTNKVSSTELKASEHSASSNKEETYVDYYYRHNIFQEIFCAAEELSMRGLISGAKWCSELASDISKNLDPQAQLDPIQPVRMFADTKYLYSRPKETVLNPIEDARFRLAKSYFDAKDFPKASQVLQNCKTAKSIFLKNYALFLEGEKQKVESINESKVTDDKSNLINKNLATIEKEYRLLYQQKSELIDGFNLYLYGVVLKNLQKTDQACQVTLESLHKYPCNWSAWEELSHLCNDKNTFDSWDLPKHWMKEFFTPLALIELNDEVAIPVYEALLSIFPSSLYLLTKKGIAFYEFQDYDSAELVFQTVLDRDPHHLQAMHTFSNILYVKEQRAKLAVLAHNSAEHYKYRPETCTIIGNYYSLRGEHEKAILYFRRAIVLDSKSYWAWGLLGHELLELKNPRAAIEAYRTAVEINPRDFRSWYNLGNAYELLDMQHYSLYYYEKTINLRPKDSRMWLAIGSCYEALKRVPEAIRSFEKAVLHDDSQGIGLYKLAKLYQKTGDQEKAAYYWQQHLNLRDEQNIEGEDVVEALYQLAVFCKKAGKLTEAEKYCSRLLDYERKEKEEAKSMLREIHQLMNQAKQKE